MVSRRSSHPQAPQRASSSQPSRPRQASNRGQRQATPRGTSVRSAQYSPAPKKSKSGMSVGAIIALVVVLGLCAAGATFYYVATQTDTFTIRSLRVEGSSHLTDEELTALAAIPTDSTLFSVNDDELRERMTKDAWIQDIAISREFPDTLVITITERTVGAVVELLSADAKTTRLWALSTDGIWLMPVPSQDSEWGQTINPQIFSDIENVLHITDVPYGEQPEIGTQCSDENVNSALTIIGSMTTSLRDRVESVQAIDASNITLLLDNGVIVAFGDEEDVRDKERVTLELLEEHENEIAYINVRAPESPTWRSL